MCTGRPEPVRSGQESSRTILNASEAKSLPAAENTTGTSTRLAKVVRDIPDVRGAGGKHVSDRWQVQLRTKFSNKW